MKAGSNVFLAALLAVCLAGMTKAAHGASIPVTNWAVLVGSSAVSGADTNSPSFASASAIQVAGGFPSIELADGQAIRGDVAVVLERAGAGGMGDNFRFALFREEELEGGVVTGAPTGALLADPTTGRGFGYTGVSVALQGPLRDHRNPNRGQPFSSGGTGAPLVIINPAGVDPEGDTVTAQNVTLHLTMTIARNGDGLDISGSITDGADYSQVFNFLGYERDDATWPMTEERFAFAWNRMAFLFGGNVNGAPATLVNARVMLIPEPASAMLMVLALAGGMFLQAGRTCRG